jgi:hypothetical protein
MRLNIDDIPGDLCVCACFEEKKLNLIIVIGIGFKSSDSGVMNITACVVGK